MPIFGFLKRQAVKTVETKSEVTADVSAQVVSEVKESPCDMFISLCGKRHSVSVSEILPTYTVTLNGRAYGVDVDEIND